MSILEVDELDRAAVSQFLRLPFKLYQKDPLWVPPLEFEARRTLDRRRNPFFRHSQAAFFLSERGGALNGRIAVLENCRYNAYNHERKAFFTLFECANDPPAAQELFEAAFLWAARRGLDSISGPKGFSALDSLGVLARGFDRRPVFGMAYNPPYYPALFEAAGLEPEGDILSGYLDGQMQFPEKIQQVADRVKERRGLNVARYRTRGDLRKALPGLQGMYNQAIQGSPGNVPLTQDEVKSIADTLLWFADPRLIKLITKADRLVGFLFAYPDISDGLRKSRGKLLPTGWVPLLRALRSSDWVILNGAGIVEDYRGLGGTALLFSEMYKSVSECGFQHIEVAQIGAENERMLRELRSFGVDFYKTHRVYQKRLA